MLAQNLLASDVIRRLAWQPPQPADEDAVRERLAESAPVRGRST